MAAFPAHGAVSVYLSHPDRQNVEAADFGDSASYTFATEQFTESPGAYAPTGTSDSGGAYAVVGGTVQISDTAAYGGGTGQGTYLSVSDGAQVDLTFDTPVNYFGFQWTAGNSGNQIALFGPSNENLGVFDTETITLMLPNTVGTSVTALDGASYATQGYYGVPGDRTTTSNEPFAYLHFVNSGSTPIARIELSHSGGGAFESDNHSTRIDAVTIDSETSPLVLVAEAIPEPSSALLLGLTGALGIFGRRRNTVA